MPTIDDHLRDALAERLGPLFHDQSVSFARDFAPLPLRPGGADRVKAFVLHHSVSSTAWTLRRLWDFHRRANGWHVGGYAIGVRSTGEVEYACGPSHTTNGVYGKNDTVMSIVAIGDYQNTAPSKALLQSVYTVFCTLDDVVGGRPWRGHQEAAVPGHGTLCPGAFLLPRLREMRGQLYGANATRPTHYP